ncbi:DsbA family protein [Minwuia sp.]|uniref:DsbA family protein n=1 Tax=Minwuia sp. TaxID=2493630 RepID=UPI003A8CC851
MAKSGQANKFGIVLIIAVAAIIGAGAFYILSGEEEPAKSAGTDQPVNQVEQKAETPSVAKPETPVVTSNTVVEVHDTDMILGAEDAPITIIEYASMTCPHCANFHQNTWPELKKNWIETGKVRFIFREFPFDRPGLAAAMLARCGGEDRFFAFIDVLFAQQARWSRSPDPMAELQKVALLGGVSPEEFEACMTDPALEETVLNSRLEGNQKYEVSATPTLIINGEKFEANHDYETLNEHLEGLI